MHREIKTARGGEEGKVYADADGRFFVKKTDLHILAMQGDGDFITVRSKVKHRLNEAQFNDLYDKAFHYGGKLNLKRVLCIPLVLSEAKSVQFNFNEETRGARKHDLKELFDLFKNHDYQHCSKTLFSKKAFSYEDFAKRFIFPFRDLAEAIVILNEEMRCSHGDLHWEEYTLR